ncbi:hypothetical protein [Brevundimonas goettingensis]|uniref:Outer membrane protein assembly factor BamE n=1 Tax=Brevundimonas goettingensis TaxID=2774190 RepID=A0A975BYM8_9CAUL|nr:hypothetical protein [Brevundimonas goettingensis]QTC90061.1 hypothetical protein IFJ75_12270 [Brevundimonas goettingensis]
MRFSARALLLAAGLALSACATQIPWDSGETALQVGMSRSQVESGFGPPTRRFTDAEGYTVWAYDRSDAASGNTTASRELLVRFVGDRVMSYSHSSTTMTTATTTSP